MRIDQQTSARRATDRPREDQSVSGSPKQYIYDVTVEELDNWLDKHGYPTYRSRQIRQWLSKGVRDVEDLSNIPARLRADLRQSFDFAGLTLLEAVSSKLDETVKYVFQLTDGNLIESVFMKYRQGASVCVSSQSGCAMGCRFCASTGAGFGRDLTGGEMAAQVALIGRDRKTRIDHATVMGIGEPLDNFDNLVRFLRYANSPQGLNISMRRITVSTCGLVPQILQLANLKLAITLAVSLHAPNDQIRESLMPVAKQWPLEELMDACRVYQQITKRRITYEYALFDQINDRPACAEQLADLLKGQLCHVNLIPGNNLPGGDLTRSEEKAIQAFQTILTSHKIACTVRRELGTDISAACGQLRRNRTI